MRTVIDGSMDAITLCLFERGLFRGDLPDRIRAALNERWRTSEAQVWSIEDVDAVLEDREIDPGLISERQKLTILRRALHREAVYAAIFDTISREIDNHFEMEGE